MKNVVAACCCAIVGLEVLIAVPLITCLAVLGVVGTDVQYVASQQPIPQYAVAPTYMPPPLSPAGFDGPEIGPPPVCPLPPTPCTVPSATLPPPVSQQVAAITEAQDRVGSPLAESTLAGDPAAVRAESNAILEQMVVQNTTSPPAPSEPGPDPIATLKPAPAPAATECEKDCPAEWPVKPALVEALRIAADQLYVKAQDLEIDGNFGRADQLRTLARGIRGEIDLLRRESGETPPPAAVTAASFHSYEPAPLDRVTASPIPMRSSLLPFRAELVEETPKQSLMMVTPKFIIQEEEEEKLGIEITPQIPAP